MTPLRVLFPLLAAAAAPLAAQSLPAEERPQPPAGRSFIQRAAGPGKLVAGAAAITLIVLAVNEHERANESWDALNALCRADNAACEVTSDGTYRDAGAEGLYQETVYYDRRAQRRLVGGQVALILARTFLIVDLSTRRDGSRNVPFDPDQAYVAPASGGGVLLGVRLTY